jgi:hypothetical protein
MDSTVIVAVFMIRAFEERKDAVLLPAAAAQAERLDYNESEAFNAFWDDAYGEFMMGAYSYDASEILYNVDYKAYEFEYNAYKEETPEVEAEEAEAAGVGA